MTNEFMPPPDSAITPEEWQQKPARVQWWIRAVWNENRQIRDTVEHLRDIVQRNSQNSSLPPSQDRPDQKPGREPSSPPLKRGGQPGHSGHHRVLVDEVDEMIVYRPIQREQCGVLLLGEDPPPYRHQVTELPLIKPIVTEHQVHELTCPCCGQRNRGELLYCFLYCAWQPIEVLICHNRARNLFLENAVLARVQYIFDREKSH